MAKLAEQYLQARGKQLYQNNYCKIYKLEIENKDKEKFFNEGKPKVFDNVCSNCKKPGHKHFECKYKKTPWNSALKCFGCGTVGHKQQDCQVKNTGMAGAALEQEDYSGMQCWKYSKSTQ